MLEYVTTAIVELFTGRVGLSEKQAARRSRALKKINPGVYEIQAPVTFKAGEVIGLEAPDKVTQAKIEPTRETLAILERQEQERIDALVAENLAKEKAAQFMNDLVSACIKVRDSGEGMTQEGLPRTDALEEIMRGEVSADQRDAAWEILAKEEPDA